MNIEDLSKSQLLLLTVLVTFVTSIATTVLTVSLLDEAPTTVTQTVNRIVERTIETVGQAPVVTTETVIVKDEEFITDAIAAAAARRVEIRRSQDGAAFATGVYLPGVRAVVTFVSEIPQDVYVIFPDSSGAHAALIRTEGGVAAYRLADDATLPQAKNPSLIDRTGVKQGQTVIALAADGSAVIGIVSKIDDSGLYTNLPETPRGSAAVNLDGNIVGLRGDTPGLYVSAEAIKALLAETSAQSG